MTNWLDRTLLVGPYLALATSEKEYLKLVKQAKVAPAKHWCGDDGYDACTHTWRKGNELICIVTINPQYTKNMPPTHVAALIVHEAIHVWQETREKIGGEIGIEGEAYAVQNICRELFNAYAKRIGKINVPL